MPTRRRPLRFENLERRDLMAGDVSVIVDGATLEVRGDHEINKIEVADNGTHLLFTADDSTTFNGQPSVSIPKAGIDKFMADLGAGSDSFRAISWNVEMDIHIDTGSGTGTNSFNRSHDVIRIFASSIVGDLEIVGNDGRDSFGIFFTTIDGNLNVDSGASDDVLFIWDVSVTGAVLVDTGPGPDRVFMRNVSTGGDLTVLTGQGRADSVFLQNGITVEGNLTIDGGQGRADSVVLQDAITVEGNLTIDGGQGNEDVLERDNLNLIVLGDTVIDGFEIFV